MKTSQCSSLLCWSWKQCKPEDSGAISLKYCKEKKYCPSVILYLMKMSSKNENTFSDMQKLKESIKPVLQEMF